MSAISSLTQHPLVHALGWGLLQSLWQIAIVGLLSAGALAVSRRAAPAVRYVIALSGLALMLAWPALTTYQAFQAYRLAGPFDARGAMGLTLTDGLERSAIAERRLDAAVAPDTALLPRIERCVPYATLFWALGVGILGLRALGGWFVARRLCRRGVSRPPDAWDARFERLIERLRVGARVRLLQSRVVEVPTAIGWIKPVVLVPASAFAGLSADQLEAILVHELAHVRRQDYLANLLQTVVETLLFYHPAAWWLSRVARAEREHCCDDVAVAMVGSRLEYARALAELELARRKVPALALGADGGPLLRRVSRVLGVERSHDFRWSAWAACGLVLTATGLALPVLFAQAPTSGQTNLDAALVENASSTVAVHRLGPGQAPRPPAPPTPPSPPAPPSAPSFSEGADGCVSHSSPGNSWKACYRGTVILTADAGDVAKLAPGGTFTVKEGGWFSSKTVEVTADKSGKLQRRYFTGFREQPYEPEGRRLLGSMLKRVIRSGFAADQRVSQLLASGGADAVLREVRMLDSEFAKKVYYTELFRQARLDGPTLARALADAGRQITSDFESAELLIAVAPRVDSDPAIASSFFEAARGIASDFEHRRALSAVLEAGSVSPATARLLLESSGGLRSDFEHAEFLIAWLRRIPLDSSVTDFLHQVDAVGSSFERARVLSSIVDSPAVSAPVLAAVLRAAGGIESAHERAQVLQLAARRHAIAGEVRAAYLSSAATLEDGVEKDEVDAALVKADLRRSRHAG